MPQDLTTTIQTVMPDHPGVVAVLWHVSGIKDKGFSTELWFHERELEEWNKFANTRRGDEWLAVRIALKMALLRDGIVRNPQHVQIRKNEKGCPHLVVYEPDTGHYARMTCSLSHKGALVFAAYSLKNPALKIGIDLEKRSWRIPYLRRKFVAEGDALIDTDDHVGNCATLWSLKEATSKVIGTGMACGFTTLRCREKSIGLCEITDADGNAYIGRYTWFGRYALSIVTEPEGVVPELPHEPAPLRKRPWMERVARARRLRALRASRAVTIPSAKENAEDA